MDLRKHLCPHALTMLCVVSGAALAQPSHSAPPPLPDPPPLSEARNLPLPAASSASALPESHALPESRPSGTDAAVPQDNEILELGPGDQIKMDVYGRPEMALTTYVAGDGTIRVPLAGVVKVGGLPPSQAAQNIERALKDGQYLVNPHVSLAVLQTLSRVSLLGKVRTPGRYPIEANTTVLDLLAQAGGPSEKGAADVVYLLRQDTSGNVSRIPIDLKGVYSANTALPDSLSTRLRGGDRIYVPPAQHFVIYGEVRTPASYRLSVGMTVLDAIAAAGGVTDKGSTHRVELRRRKPDGSLAELSARLTDKLEPDDVITVKERIF